jgi:hypothetical protein
MSNTKKNILQLDIIYPIHKFWQHVLRMRFIFPGDTNQMLKAKQNVDFFTDYKAFFTKLNNSRTKLDFSTHDKA